MSKAKTPFFSLGSSGTVANAITTQKRGKLTVVRKKPIPTDPKSPAQLAQRQKYQDAVAEWNALSKAEKETWRGVCPGLPPYPCFMRTKLLEPPEPPPPEDIYIGQEAINRPDYQFSDRTIIAGVPADGTGKITEIQLYVDTPLSRTEVATFIKVGLDTFTTRAFQSIENVSSGYHTVPVDLDVVAGDFLGIYYKYGGIDLHQTGYEGIWVTGDDWIPCTNKVFPPYAGRAISLHGTGKTS